MAKKPSEAGKAEGKYNGKANLKYDFSPDERAANGRKGGVASGVAKRTRKTMASVLKEILMTELPEEEARERLKAVGLDGTYMDGISMAMIERAGKGDVEAGRFVRDTIGEKPREGVDLTLDEKPLASIDMTKMSDEQLQQLAAQRAEQE